MLKNRDSHSSLELTIGVTMISFSAVFVKLAHTDPTAAGFYRMAFGSLILLVIALASKTTLFSNRKSFALAILAGILFAGDLTFWHRSIIYVGPGLATILASFQVFFVTAIAIIFLKERPHWRAIAAIPLALLGLFLLVGTQWSELGGDYHLGVIFGLITACFYASYVLTIRKAQTLPNAPTPMATITISTISTAIATGIISLILGESFALPGISSGIWLALYGLCGQVLGWVFITRSIPHLPAARVSLTLLLQPALSFIWDLIFFSRPTILIEVIGAVVTLCAIYLGSLRTESKIEL